jgi:alkaline phosphatase D
MASKPTKGGGKTSWSFGRRALLIAAGAALGGLVWRSTRPPATPPGIPTGTPVAMNGMAKPLDASTLVERIAFGSCLDQKKPQPIWRDVMATKPQLLLMMGDNVYGDFEDDNAEKLRQAYEALGAHPDFTPVRAAVPILPIWDDHDLGRNDGGADFPQLKIATKLFREFWGTMHERPMDQGLYFSRTYGPAGRRVQIILLDMRSFRSPLKRKSNLWPFNGQYEPDPDPSKTHLGEQQWAWLEAELAKPADVRVIVSSIQVLAEGHGWERWGNFPLQYERLKIFIAKSSGPAPIVLLSGDRHFASMYSLKIGEREVVEVTASSLNIPLPFANTDTRVPPLATEIFSEENFGTAAIDWSTRQITLALVAKGGKTLVDRTIKF